MEYDADTEYLTQHPDAQRSPKDARLQRCGGGMKMSWGECDQTGTWRVKPWESWHTHTYCPVHARRILQAVSFVKSGGFHNHA